MEKNAYEAFVLAFDNENENGPKPDVVSEQKAYAKFSKLRRRPATPVPQNVQIL